MNKTELNNNLTDEEKLRVAVLRRLNQTGIVETCSSFGVGPSKPGSKDKFTVGFVVRHEFTNTDTPVTVTLHKGVSADDAIEALKYVIDIIWEADSKTKAGKMVHSKSFHLAALVMAVFNLPGAGLTWLIKQINRKI